jgi:glycosyltransferase involved in cell wall biosynthesis
LHRKKAPLKANRLPVSVLILTLNEEQNLGSCVAALSAFDDVVVLDSFSVDGTVALAERLGARTYLRAFDNFSAQRNFALDNVAFKHDWILHLDADEVMTEELCAEIRRAIEDPRYDAYHVPSRLMFFGQWLRYSGMYPAYQVRLGRKSALRFAQVGHGQREAIEPERIGTLRNPYLHFSFSKGMADWFEKHNRYSSDEASAAVARLREATRVDWAGLVSFAPTRRRRALKEVSVHLPFRPVFRFLYMYFIRLGFLDGRAGWTYCRMIAVYEFMIVVKIREMNRKRWLGRG